MKTARAREVWGERGEEGREKRRRAETRFIWIPGKRPVNVPARMPANRERKTWSSIKLLIRLS